MEIKHSVQKNKVILTYFSFLSSSVIGLIFGLFCPVYQLVNSQNNSAYQQALAASSYLRVTKGEGKINRSDYPQYIPPNKTKATVDNGGYNPNNRTIMLDLKGRLVEIKLQEPLVDNKSIKFTATYPGKLRNDLPRLITYIPINSEIVIQQGFKTEGTIIKNRNQIKGKFKSRGAFFFFFSDRPEGTGSVDGEFTLTVQPGTRSNLPGPIVPASW